MTTATKAKFNILTEGHKRTIDQFVSAFGKELEGGETDWAAIDSKGNVQDVRKATIQRIFVRNQDVIVRLNGSNVRASRYQILEKSEAHDIRKRIEDVHTVEMQQQLKRRVENWIETAKLERDNIIEQLADGGSIQHIFDWKMEPALRAELRLAASKDILSVFKEFAGNYKEQREALIELYQYKLRRFIEDPYKTSSTSVTRNFIAEVEHQVKSDVLREMKTFLMIKGDW